MQKRIEQELELERPWLYRLAYALVRDRTSAESLRPWLASVLRNLVRSRARRMRSALRWRQDPVDLPQESSPEDLALRYESLHQVTRFIAFLAEPYRSTVLLCYDDGLSPIEVARRQGCARHQRSRCDT